MFFYEGYTCPVCGEKFKESDDIVACPECGAPHHRDCWKKEGHCHFVADHGTDRQWVRPQAGDSANSAESAVEGKVCPHCGEKNPEFAEFCSRCGKDLPASDWSSVPPPPPQGPPQASYTPPPYPGGAYGEYTPFRMPTIDPCGGVPKEETIEGVSVEDMASVTGMNSAYYVPRFYKMSKGGSKCSWNWPAFLLTPYWLLYRKNYWMGVVLMVLNVVRTAVSAYILNVQIAPVLSPLLGEGSTIVDEYRILMEKVMNGDLAIVMWIMALMGLADLLIRLFFGLSGNYWYMRTCVSRVKRLRSKKPDMFPAELTAAGGTSFLLGASAYAILYFSSLLISTLIATVFR